MEKTSSQITGLPDAAQASEINGSEIAGYKPTILIVDDDQAVRLIMREVLETEEFDILEAENGVQALAICEQSLPSLILMDVEMPEMDGITACQQIQQYPDSDQTVVVMVTGLDDYDSIENAYNAGATDFITKPINWPILSHRIRYLLRNQDIYHSLVSNQKRLSNAQSIACLGDWTWDVVQDVITASEQMYRLFGETPGLKPASLNAFLQRVPGEDRSKITQAFEQVLEQADAPNKLSHRILRKDGSEGYVNHQVYVSFNEQGQAISVQGVMQDITDIQKAEKKIENLSNYDSLTGLPNRNLLAEHFVQDQQHMGADEQKTALLYIDVDRFKRVNDSEGYQGGDQILRILGRRINNLLTHSSLVKQRSDKHDGEALLSRIGGDEFILYLSGDYSTHRIIDIAQAVLAEISAPIVLQDHEFFLTAHIGISLAPDDGEDFSTLTRNAETALDQAKQGSDERYKFFNQSMNEQALRRISLETKLYRAIKDEEFVLYYQPKVDISSGELIGLEALVRWRQSDGGLISPAEFIPLAEETGLIVELGEWVMHSACKQAVEWQQLGYPALQISINLSPRQFMQNDIVASIQGALDLSGLAPELLDVEITEGVIMQDIEANIDVLRGIKNLGVELSIDDFGTGYSSMSYLKKLPLDTLKIDRSFVIDITRSNSDLAITKSIVSLARNLKLKTIAEGVETVGQRQILSAIGCEMIQGFLISKPIPAEEITQSLDNHWGT